MKVLTSTNNCGNQISIHYSGSLIFFQIVKAIKLLLVCCLFSGHSIAQKASPQLEINPFVRLDKYPKFSYKTGGVSRDEITLKGTSWGVNFAYKIPLKKNISIKVGLGYYRYSFDKINRENTSFGASNDRIIDYPSTYYIVYTTGKYAYNIVSTNLSIEKQLASTDNLEIKGGLGLSNHITFSQYYHINSDYPVGPKHGRYISHQFRYFGTSGNLYFSLLKKIGKTKIGPSLLIPLFDTWKQDVVFPEESNSKIRNKWSGGIGIGVVFSIPLTFNN